jgi:hypothetical protein
MYWSGSLPTLPPMKPYSIPERQVSIWEKNGSENQLLWLFYETCACRKSFHRERAWGREGSLLGIILFLELRMPV